MKIGMIVAIQEEIDVLLRTCGDPLQQEEASGYIVYRYALGEHRVFVTGSGAGELSAAAAAQFLITRYGVDLLLNYGVCGGLTEDMGLLRTVLVEKAVHYDFDASAFYGTKPAQYPGFPDCYLPASDKLLRLAREAEPDLPAVICASGDKFIEDPAVKARLHRDFGAEICEMEAAGILLTAARCGVPALLVKGVSDSVGGDAAEFSRMVHESASVCLQLLLKLVSALS